MAVEAFAPAKVNLTLHVTGRRADGYHLLDSLVVFAAVGDRLRLVPAAELGLSLAGPMAAGLTAGPDNLVLRAARLFPPGRGARITLDKRLPVAAGIGGGSSDAAAALRGLSRLWDAALPGPAEVLSLGADVPVCLRARPVRMSGVGEVLAPVAGLPQATLVLVNPGIAVATADVFRGLIRRDNPPMPTALPRLADAAALAGWLARQRNDLEGPARALAPAIGSALAALAAQPGCLLARMSGSGATCFGLFAGPEAAAAAARALARPGWWVAEAPLLDPATPLVSDQEMRSTT